MMPIGRKPQEGNGEELGDGDLGSPSGPIVLSQHRNQEKVSQSHPPISKASGSSQLGIWPDVKKKGHCKNFLVGGSGLSFLLGGGCFI